VREAARGNADARCNIEKLEPGDLGRLNMPMRENWIDLLIFGNL
jgi:hypothetical protein